jgi:sugar/nucleoside kinase (ribokinase family)
VTWVEMLAPFVHVLVPDAPTVAKLDLANPFDAEIYQQAEDLAERLRVNVVVPPGPSDALLVGQGIGAERVEGPEVDDVPTAGDSFRGVLAVLLAEKIRLPEAVRVAVRAASFATITGTLPTRAELAAVT